MVKSSPETRSAFEMFETAVQDEPALAYIPLLVEETRLSDEDTRAR
jgi:hypothetical protein